MTGIFIIITGSVTLLCAAIIWFSYNEPEQRKDWEFESDQSALQNSIDDESISIPGFESIKIPSEQTVVSSPFYNPQSNSCYFEITVFLSDTNEMIYQSKLITPGQKLYRIELMRTLTEGEYAAVIQYKTFSIEDFSVLNGANLPVTLIVE
jgi:hypothetical protein